MIQERGAAPSGTAYALAAFGIWGFAPAYWKAVGAIPAPELLAHRVLWSCVVAALLTLLLRDGPRFAAALRSPRLLLPACAAALLIGVNWLTFLYAVATDRVLATSLGYYINPLVSVLFGTLFLRERLRPIQIVAVLLAAAGVAQLAVALGELPWIALVLCFSFALYGLVRKLAPAAPLVGFAIEVTVLGPLAAVYLAWLALDGSMAFPVASGWRNALVAGAGVVTAAPLLAFASAAKRLRLSTLGLFQYLAPSIAFLLAVGLYGEPFSRAHAITFGCVWIALAIYSLDAARAARGR